MSKDLKGYLHGKGVVTSRTTAYNPKSNGQCERFNGIIWKTVLLALKQKDLQTSQWEVVLPDALHAVRSLLCTSINATPHEKFFIHPRRSCSGSSMPSWLLSQGPVWLKKHIRSKSDPLVEEVFLLDANPKYPYIQYPDGRETTVSLRDLAPQGLEGNGNNRPELILAQPENNQQDLEVNQTGNDDASSVLEEVKEVESPDVRRSSRANKGKPPDRLGINLTGED